MKCQILFSRKSKKSIISLSSAAPSVVSVKYMRLYVRKHTQCAPNEDWNLPVHLCGQICLSCQYEEMVHPWLFKVCPVKILMGLRECARVWTVTGCTCQKVYFLTVTSVIFVGTGEADVEKKAEEEKGEFIMPDVPQKKALLPYMGSESHSQCIHAF